MVPLDSVFVGFILIFGLMGALRGWAKELLVTFSIIVALSARLIFTQNVPFVRELIVGRPDIQQFYIYTVMVIGMAIAGYAGPVVSARLAGASAREQIEDILLGFVLGALNGYLIVGSIWYFLHQAGYGIWGIQPPGGDTVAMALATKWLPPQWLAGPVLLTVFVFASVFVVIVIV